MHAYSVYRRPQFQGVPPRSATETMVSPQPHVHGERTTAGIPGTMHRARATPLFPTPLDRLEPQELQDVPHRDPLAEQAEVYTGHRVTFPPANREEEPVLEPAASASHAARADSIVRLGRHRPAGRGSPAAAGVSELAAPGRQRSPLLSIRHMIVAVRRITATRAMFEPRRRLIR